MIVWKKNSNRSCGKMGVLRERPLPPRERKIAIHLLFLAAYLGLLWYPTWRESSFDCV
jgi:hypothetical protein